MGEGTALKGCLDLLMSGCALKFHSAIKIFGREQIYAFRCVQAEYAMRFSEIFLEGCIDIARSQNDRFWSDYFERHLEEERGHHLWAKEDLEVLNSYVSHQWTISHHVVELLNFQRACIESGSFLPQLGYCICVESYQGTPEYWNRFRTHTSLPSTAFRNALRHAVLDVSHSEELWSIFERLDSHERAQVADSAVYTAKCQLNMFADILKNHVS